MAVIESTTQQERPEVLPPWRHHNLHYARRCEHLAARDVADFACLALDVSRGVRTVMQLLETSDLDAENNDADGSRLPGLSVWTASNLQRLAIVSAELLEYRAEDFLSRVTAGAGWDEQGEPPTNPAPVAVAASA